MGDHRAECHIQFKYHGKEYRLDLDWVNWCPSEGIDTRVVEFFDDATQDALDRYHDGIREDDERRKRADQEEHDRAEFSRLKAKFELET